MVIVITTATTTTTKVPATQSHLFIYKPNFAKGETLQQEKIIPILILMKNILTQIDAR